MQIRAGTATPLPRRQSAPPPPPPAPGQQGGGGGGGGGGIARPMPQAQHQNMTAPMPAVPLHAIPSDLRGRPPFQVSDLRNEHMTEGDARESLTHFKVIRFQKSRTHNEFDADGKAVKPTWARCEIIDENDMEQMEARKRIKALEKERSKDDKPVTITDKKSSLPAMLKTQLERQQFDLQRHDDQRFTHTLVQLEDLTKPYEHPKSKKNDSRDWKENKKKEKKFEWDSRKSSSDKRDQSKAKVKERIGIRAYFKRSPNQEQDCKGLFFQLSAEKQQREHFHREQQRMMHQHQQHEAAMHQQPHPQTAMNQHPPGVRDVQVVQKDKHRSRSVHSSDDSDSSGWSSSEDEFQTPMSSVGSNASREPKNRRREKKHHKDKAKYYNVNRAPRALPVAEGLYVVTNAPQRGVLGTPLSPQPRLPPLEVDRLRNMRYWDSEAQYDFERREREEESRRRAIEPAYPQRPLLERRDSYIRMSPLEPRRDRFEDLEYERNHRENMARLDRMMLDEEERERERERDRRLSDAALDRALYDRPRQHRVIVTADGLYDPEPAYHAPYVRTRGSSYLDQEVRAEDYIERRSSDFEPHPFAPRVRRRVYEDRLPA